MIFDGLANLMINSPALDALVDGRVWPQIIPQSDANQVRQPCVVYALVDRQRAVRYCGTDKLVEAVYRIDAYGLTYAQSKDVAQAVQDLLIDYSGTLDGYRVHHCRITSELDLSDPDPGLYRVSMTFAIWHQSQRGGDSPP